MKPYGYAVLPAEIVAKHTDTYARIGDVMLHSTSYFKIGYTKFRTLAEAETYCESHPRNSIVACNAADTATTAYIADLAAQISTTPESMGIDAYKIGKMIQAHGGYTRRSLGMKNNALPEAEQCNIELLDNPEFLSIVKGMYFKNQDGEWYCLRRPQSGDVWQWQRDYCRVFGDTSEEARKLVEAIEAAEAAHIESQRPKVERPHNRTHYEDLPTLTIAHRATLMTCLASQAMNAYIHTAGKQEIYRYLWHFYTEEYNILQSELKYRTEAQPKERKSKRATEKATADFRSANEHLAAQGDSIFTKAYQQILASADYPLPLHLDEIIPRDIPENTPPSLQETRDLLQTVIKLADLDLDPTSFEAEDRALLMKTIRKTLEAIKANHILKEKTP